MIIIVATRRRIDGITPHKKQGHGCRDQNGPSPKRGFSVGKHVWCESKRRMT